MNFLAIDIGNTRIKVLNEQENINQTFVFTNNHEFINYINSLDLTITSIILCDVRNKVDETINKILKNAKHFILLNQTTKLPIINKYETPETLGYDRIAAVIGASTLHPNYNLLVIDVGTAITYDIITINKEYLGGAISPGINLRFKSLHENTGKLPLLTTFNNNIFPAKNTFNCIETGVLNSVIFEIERYIDIVTEQFSPIKIILTGGDAQNLVKFLKKPIFVNTNLVLIGLINILKYNVL
jgi:type III pantothenate kinase